MRCLRHILYTQCFRSWLTPTFRQLIVITLIRLFIVFVDGKISVYIFTELERGWEGVNRMYLNQGQDQWQAPLKMVMNFQVP